jgi:hypothetical protein
MTRPRPRRAQQLTIPQKARARGRSLRLPAWTPSQCRTRLPSRAHRALPPRWQTRRSRPVPRGLPNPPSPPSLLSDPPPSRRRTLRRRLPSRPDQLPYRRAQARNPTRRTARRRRGQNHRLHGLSVLPASRSRHLARHRLRRRVPCAQHPALSRRRRPKHCRPSRRAMPSNPRLARQHCLRAPDQARPKPAGLPAAGPALPWPAVLCCVQACCCSPCNGLHPGHPLYHYMVTGPKVR